MDPQTGDSFRIVCCPICDLGVTDPAPENLDRYYAEGYHGGRHGFTAKWCDYRRSQIIHQLGDASSSKRLLDVGCGDGTFLQAMASAGWQVTGVEKYPGTSRVQGVEIFDSVDQAQSVAPFDCVTLWHVLEHLPHPSKVLQSLRSLLAPSGILVVAVPDFGSFAAKRFGASWLHLDVPRHLFHFTRHSLHGLLAEQGFAAQQLKGSEFEYDLMGLAQSVLNASGAESNAFMKRLTGRPTRTTGWKAALQLLAGSMICSVGAIPVGISGRFGKAGTLIMVARVATPISEAHS